MGIGRFPISYMGNVVQENALPVLGFLNWEVCSWHHWSWCLHGGLAFFALGVANKAELLWSSPEAALKFVFEYIVLQKDGWS